MAQFFKYFFASLLAIVVFCLLAFFILLGLAGSLASREEVVISPSSVLYLDLSQSFSEQAKEDMLGPLGGSAEFESPGIYDLVRMIRFAASDNNIDGIYLKCGGNANGYGTSEELRNALLEFKRSKKFIIAYGEVIPQLAYHVASVADKVYVHPKGGIEWKGLGMEYVFFKKALDRLEIQPQIFYAGKFKSATEPFREEKMTDANKLQSMELLEDLYTHLLAAVGSARKIDTAQLRTYANTYALRTANDAVRLQMADAVKYEDEVKEEIRRKTGATSIEKIGFVSMSKYSQGVNFKGGSGTDRIALIYAEGNIVDGSGDENNIGGDRFRKYIRKARLDSKVKAIVVRINSGGGSAMASENMWREIALAKKDKPVVVSYGDVAASGGYYMACNADSIFALPTTITGSIGVFSIIPNMKGFFSDKVGVTFDGVKTGPYANHPSITEPLSDAEKAFYQADVDSIYQTFLGRVAEGRKMKVAMVDSVGQGRIWAGNKAIRIGLVDRLGGMDDAVNAAAKLAGLKAFRIREYPEPVGLLERLSGSYKRNVHESVLQRELGEGSYRLYQEWLQLKGSIGNAQARMPFRIVIH
ncbi:signal peptide peptidase SppA [Flavihumibacter rivuli]|uniref:signal peptide peptidase SppA n=1 Tax=Flavihumibacter rivuli TaxID=2838156 RepID=UPI001BDEE383|nr:signal peptide peptidase SppA [Flavihumibacter rivuli]ULQ57339.1 signal peptide peptidase SppA [Flavihumibacter rivuli]